MTDTSYYQNLRRSMVFTVFLLSFVPMLAISAITAYEFHTAYTSRVHELLREQALKHKRAIDSFLAERLAEVRLLTEVTPHERFRDEGELERMLKSLQELHGGVFVDLGLVNARGAQVAYAGPFRLENAGYAGADWFVQAQNKRYSISDVFLGLRGTPHFVVTARVRAGGEDLILRATIDFLIFSDLVEGVNAGDSGLAFVMSERGELQTRPRRDVSGEIPFLVAFIAEQRARLGGEWARGSAAAGAPAFSRGTAVLTFGPDSASGRESVFVVAPLKGGGWTLVYQQGKDEAYASLNQARRLAFLVLGLSALAVLFCSVAIARRMIGRIEEADRAKDMMNEQVIQAGKLVSVGELAAGIAHEINNPVAVMMEETGWLQDLMEDEQYKNAEGCVEIKRALAQIRNQGVRCKGITHKLLSFAHRIDPTEQSMQANAVADEMLALSEQRARLASVRIVRDLAPDLPEITGAPSELQQVLINLINNAIDAMEQKGGELKLSTRRDGDHVLLVVADTGEGIPKANVARLFDPFFTTKPVGKGTGLGLSICYGIVRKMGGEIMVDSSVGQGTTFTVRLPVTGPAGESKTR